MSQIRTPEIDKLYQDVLSYRSTNQFKELLDFIKRFRHIAPYNAMLVHTQKPGSQFVTSAREWKYKYGRDIKPGARPLVILQPFGPVAFVYEYNDTVGKPLPDSVMAPFKSETKIDEAQLDRLINNLMAEGVGVYFNNYGTNSAGRIEYHDEEDTLEMSIPGGVCHLISHHTIITNSNLSPAEKYATILHELGHLYCGHIYHDHKVEKWLPERFRLGLTMKQKEFEAETVCWLVCERLGISNPSAAYLSGYLENNKEIPDISIDAILKAAGTIEIFTKPETKERRKELIIDVVKKGQSDGQYRTSVSR